MSRILMVATLLSLGLLVLQVTSAAELQISRLTHGSGSLADDLESMRQRLLGTPSKEARSSRKLQQEYSYTYSSGSYGYYYGYYGYYGPEYQPYSMGGMRRMLSAGSRSLKQAYPYTYPYSGYGYYGYYGYYGAPYSMRRMLSTSSSSAFSRRLQQTYPYNSAYGYYGYYGYYYGYGH